MFAKGYFVAILMCNWVANCYQGYCKCYCVPSICIAIDFHCHIGIGSELNLV